MRRHTDDGQKILFYADGVVFRNRVVPSRPARERDPVHVFEGLFMGQWPSSVGHGTVNLVEQVVHIKGDSA